MGGGKANESRGQASEKTVVPNPWPNSLAASLRETILKDHRKSGRARIYDDLKMWPTTPSQSKFAFEGFNYQHSEAQKRAAAVANGGGSKAGAKTPEWQTTVRATRTGDVPKGSLDTRYFHRSDEIIAHYEVGLRTGMKVH